MDKKAYNQVYAIIEYMPEEMKKQLPVDLINAIKANRDLTYNCEIEELDDIEFLEDTMKILSVLYTDYFASEEERKIILAKEKMLREQKDLEKREKYNPENIFHNNIKNENLEKSIEINKSEMMIIYKKDFFKKLFNKIKSWLKI